MKEQLRTYIVYLTDDVPHNVYEGLLALLGAGILILLLWKGWSAWKLIARLILIVYVFLFYSTTVLYRPIFESRKYNFTLFWSYSNSELLVENLMNVLIFIPVGLLIGMGFSKWSWWKAISLGCLCSISIEALQFAFKRGFCELDDVIHNTLGCVIGFGIAKLIVMVYLAIVKLVKLV